MEDIFSWSQFHPPVAAPSCSVSLVALAAICVRLGIRVLAKEVGGDSRGVPIGPFSADSPNRRLLCQRPRKRAKFQKVTQASEPKIERKIRRRRRRRRRWWRRTKPPPRSSRTWPTSVRGWGKNHARAFSRKYSLLFQARPGPARTNERASERASLLWRHFLAHSAMEAAALSRPLQCTGRCCAEVIAIHRQAMIADGVGCT